MVFQRNETQRKKKLIHLPVNEIKVNHNSLFNELTNKNMVHIVKKNVFI